MKKIKQVQTPTFEINGKTYVCTTRNMFLDDFLNENINKEIYLYSVEYNKIRAVVI